MAVPTDCRRRTPLVYQEEVFVFVAKKKMRQVSRIVADVYQIIGSDSVTRVIFFYPIECCVPRAGSQPVLSRGSISLIQIHGVNPIILEGKKLTQNGSLTALKPLKA